MTRAEDLRRIADNESVQLVARQTALALAEHLEEHEKHEGERSPIKNLHKARFDAEYAMDEAIADKEQAEADRDRYKGDYVGAAELYADVATRLREAEGLIREGLEEDTGGEAEVWNTRACAFLASSSGAGEVYIPPGNAVSGQEENIVTCPGCGGNLLRGSKCGRCHGNPRPRFTPAHVARVREVMLNLPLGESLTSYRMAVCSALERGGEDG